MIDVTVKFEDKTWALPSNVGIISDGKTYYCEYDDEDDDFSYWEVKGTEIMSDTKTLFADGTEIILDAAPIENTSTWSWASESVAVDNQFDGPTVESETLERVRKAAAKAIESSEPDVVKRARASKKLEEMKERRNNRRESTSRPTVDEVSDEELNIDELLAGLELSTNGSDNELPDSNIDKEFIPSHRVQKARANAETRRSSTRNGGQNTNRRVTPEDEYRKVQTQTSNNITREDNQGATTNINRVTIEESPFEGTGSSNENIVVVKVAAPHTATVEPATEPTVLYELPNGKRLTKAQYEALCNPEVQYVPPKQYVVRMPEPPKTVYNQVQMPQSYPTQSRSVSPSISKLTAIQSLDENVIFDNAPLLYALQNLPAEKRQSITNIIDKLVNGDGSLTLALL